MMKKMCRAHFRILGIAPSSRGFGFAVLEGEEKLIDWGVRSSRKEKNPGAVAKVEALMRHYQPGTLVLEDPAAKHSRRSIRIRALSGKIVAAAKNHDVRVALLSREQVRRKFFPDEKGTKDSLAQILASRFPQELESRLPPKRRPWMSEDYRMGIFDAVALAVALRVSKG